jgi:hypothetical protein
MACDISNGRLEACKDGISGLDAIYFINYGINYPTDVTFDTVNPGMEDVIVDVAGVTDLYKWELKGANSFEQTIQTSRDNGTTFFEQTIVAQFKVLDPTTHKTVKLLAYGRPHVVVRTRSGNYFLAGLERGCDVTAGTISSGTAMGDFNGYNLTFTAMENIPAPFLDCTDETTLTAIFGLTTADIVTT